MQQKCHKMIIHEELQRDTSHDCITNTKGKLDHLNPFLDNFPVQLSDFSKNQQFETSIES